MLDVVFGQATDPGKVRTNNEDAMGSFVPNSRQQARSHGYLFAVADGVGGSDLGEVASATAIETVTREFARAQENTLHVSLLPRLVQHANSAVHDATLTPERRGKSLATTLVLCALRHDKATICHVGDSRCYLIRDRTVNLLTQDHTWVNQQRKLGLISAQEAAESESRHILIRSLGPELFISSDTTTVPIMPGDVLVLCSDGLHGGMPERKMAEIVAQDKDMNEIARELVSTGVDLDGDDNTTAQVIRVVGVEKIGMYRGRPYRLPS
jgi:protein phosphatase